MVTKASKSVAPPNAEAPFDAAAVRCTHCGLDVPQGLIAPDALAQFCCHGCEMAYSIIHTCGLDRYYRIRDEIGSTGRRLAGTKHAYTEYDDPVFQRLYVRGGGAGLMACDLYVENVHCAACIWLLEKLPSFLPGVVSSTLDFRRAVVTIVWQHEGTSLSAIARLLDSLGYPPHPARDVSVRTARALEERRRLVNLAVAGACAGNVMLLALALYAGLFDTMDASYAQLFRWTSMAISLVSLAWPGATFFKSAWTAIRTRTLNLDVPISLGLAAGALAGVVNTLLARGEIYFDSLSVLVFLLLVGRLIQSRQQRWSADAVELLFSLTPTSAHVVDEADPARPVRELPIEAVTKGALVRVRAGDSFPADGMVESGASSIDMSLLTGESRPVPVIEGDAVAAGSANLGAELYIRVTATGADTRVGKLMQMVEECSRRRAPIVRFADRLAGHFTIGMLALSAATLVLWLFINPAAALDNATSLLIVTCPCALGLATPLVLTVAIGRGARRGILIKGGDAVENLSRPGTIFLDKTGTITHGKLSLLQWHGDESAKPLVAALERCSSHPLAAALRNAAPVIDTEFMVRGVRQTPGAGICGIVNSREIRVGTLEFSGQGVRPQWAVALSAEAGSRGRSPVTVTVDGVVVAVAVLGDAVRADAAESIARLRAMGWHVMVLSGDHDESVKAVADQVGLDRAFARGRAAPEDKVQAVTAAGARGPVVMVGDGVNDAAALAAATVGIAVHGGAEASLAAADVYMAHPGLRGVVDLIDASRRTLRVIKRNLAASLFYNLLAAGLAITGYIHPMIAAVIMPISSLTVLTLSFRSRTFGAAGRDKESPCQ